MLQSLANRFVREVKASWPKAALLTVLLVVGLFVWVPPLIRALTGGASKPAPGVRSANRPPADAGAPTAALPPAPDVPADTATRSLSGWREIDEILETDPLVRSVEVAAIRSDPFRMDHDQFPPPVLFVDEDADAPSPAARAGASRSAGRDGLVLKSTIVGVNRRAAYINRKLYFEGADVVVDGKTYRLAAVHPRKVVLRQGDTVIELRIAPPSAQDAIDLRREVHEQ